MLISIIVPCYNEKYTINIFYNEMIKIIQELENYDFEIIFIDDGSIDTTLEVIKNLSKQDTRIKYVSFSRNFGKEAAMYAGLICSQGELVGIMDVDLQDPPSLIPEMIKIINDEGYDCVATRRVSRKGEPKIRSFFARKFYKLMKKISKVELVDGARDYRLMTRQYVDCLLSLKEYNRFSKGLFGWIGFNTKWLEYENVQRSAGETKWTFIGLLLYSIEGIVAFSTTPLIISVLLGIVSCFIAFFMVIFIVVRALIYGDPTPGWPSLASIILFIGGIQLLCIGILGEYLSKTYLEVKKRPIYITKESNIIGKDV